MMRFNILAMSGKAVEAAGDVHTLILDKTGTITVGTSASDSIHSLAGCDADAARCTRPIWRRLSTHAGGPNHLTVGRTTRESEDRQAKLDGGAWIEFTAATLHERN